MRRTPLRRISKKRKQQLDIYSDLRREHLLAHPYCRNCLKPATDIHHRKPRGRGGKLNDPTNFVSVCRQCHKKIHDNPKWAEEIGLLIK
jgi:5-methylcytosine-specific restriction endonuclease McrA